MYRCPHCRVVVELRNPAEMIETVATGLPGCDELRRRNDATRVESGKASGDCLRLAKLGAERLGVPWNKARRFSRVLATWVKAGMPERTHEEQLAIRRICERCWNRPKCWADEVIAEAAISCATWHCPIHSWERAGHGCGDELHRLIVRLTRQEVTHDCGCGNWITKMNRWTAAENRQHIQQTAAKVQREAEKRGWLLNRAVRFPFAPTGMKWMIEWAIRRAERWEKKMGVKSKPSAARSATVENLGIEILALSTADAVDEVLEMWCRAFRA